MLLSYLAAASMSSKLAIVCCCWAGMAESAMHADVLELTCSLLIETKDDEGFCLCLGTRMLPGCCC